MGDTAEAGARPPGQDGSSSGAGGTPTPTVEELMRENASLKQSVQGLAHDRDEWKGKATASTGAYPGQEGAAPNDEEYLTVGTARKLVTDSISGWWGERQREANAQAEAVRERGAWLDKAYAEVPDAKDPTGAIYKKAVELFTNPAEGLSRNVNGQLLPSYPNAEYIAILRAKSLVGAAGAGAAEQRAGATFASAGGPSGGGASAGGDGGLSDEEYLKLSPEERAQYQDRKFLEKHGQAP